MAERPCDHIAAADQAVFAPVLCAQHTGNVPRDGGFFGNDKRMHGFTSCFLLRRAALLDWLAGELAGGEAVLDAAVKRVTVQADALLVELEELPLCFRVRAQAGGRGAARRVEVTECTPLPR